MDRLICASLSHTHYWYEVGMLKVPRCVTPVIMHLLSFALFTEISLWSVQSRVYPFSCCCCCLHIKRRSDLYSVLSNIRTGPTDANAFFRGHRLTTQRKGTHCEKNQKEIKGPRKVNTHAIIGKEKKSKNRKIRLQVGALLVAQGR